MDQAGTVIAPLLDILPTLYVWQPGLFSLSAGSDIFFLIEKQGGISTEALKASVACKPRAGMLLDFRMGLEGDSCLVAVALEGDSMVASSSGKA